MRSVLLRNVFSTKKNKEENNINSFVFRSVWCYSKWRLPAPPYTERQKHFVLPCVYWLAAFHSFFAFPSKRNKNKRAMSREKAKKNNILVKLKKNSQLIFIFPKFLFRFVMLLIDNFLLHLRLCFALLSFRWINRNMCARMCMCGYYVQTVLATNRHTHTRYMHLMDFFLFDTHLYTFAAVPFRWQIASS